MPARVAQGGKRRETVCSGRGHVGTPLLCNHDFAVHKWPMRKKDEAKRHAIFEATVAEVVAGGLAGASIASIARRAGVSQGTIYLYHADKDALLRASLLEAKRRIHDALMRAAEGSDGPASAIRAQWFALHAFVEEQPDVFLFAEHAMNAGLLRGSEPELARMGEEMLAPIESGLRDGTLRKAPPAAIASVLTAPAVQLARRRAIGATLDQALIEATFDLAWKGVSTPS